MEDDVILIQPFLSHTHTEERPTNFLSTIPTSWQLCINFNCLRHYCFNCLHSHLKSLKLRFGFKEPNSFEVCLPISSQKLNCKVLIFLRCCKSMMDTRTFQISSHINTAGTD